MSIENQQANTAYIQGALIFLHEITLYSPPFADGKEHRRKAAVYKIDFKRLNVFQVEDCEGLRDEITVRTPNFDALLHF